MYIIEVTPIGRGVLPESLSYFSHITYPRGTLLHIPVRSRAIPAIVTTATEAFSMKAALRAATFSLRKLPPQEITRALSTAFLDTAEATAAYHGTSINASLFGMLPKEIREGTIPLPTFQKTEESIPPHDSKPRIFIAPTKDRAQEYERMVRESFAARQSIVFVVPTHEYIAQYKEHLSKGIASYTVVLSSARTPSSLASAYAQIATEEHPLLIITTPHYACIERADIGVYILEHERSNGYVSKTRPYFDYRYILTSYAARRGIACIIADTVVRSEEIYALHTEAAIPFAETAKRIELPGTLEVLLQEPNKDMQFELISPELSAALAHAIKTKKRVFLFCARRGLAPLISCIDCGEILRDPTSGAPLSLFRSMVHGVEKRWLISSVSGYRAPASDLCPQCGSWRLKERGIGIQQVYDTLTTLFPRDALFLFDHQTASTEKKAHAIRTAFYAKKGSILLGTALALPYLTEPVDMSGVVSMDSLRALPSWRGQEEAFNILLLLREKTHGSVFVQTRTNDELFEYVRRGNLSDFYTQELAVREECHYPPFVVFIHFAWKASPRDSIQTKKLLSDMFAENNLSLYSAPNGEEGTIHYGLLRVPSALWPDTTLLSKIRMLPPSIRVIINPDRIV